MRRRHLIRPALLGLLLPAITMAQQANYPANQPPLKPAKFIALPLGSVHAQGWLLKQLELQRDGLTGNAERVLQELDATSAWLGGDKDNWERSPYYVKGLISLAYTLDDAALKQKAQKWVDWALGSQQPDGFYGPKQNNDWWPRMVSNYYLRDYYDATEDPRVLPFLSKYYRNMLSALPQRPLVKWGKGRAGDDMDTVIWLYNRTKEPFLLDLLDLLRTQAYDWPTIFAKNQFLATVKDTMPKHAVNVAQAMKMPVVAWERSGDPADRTSIDSGYRSLMAEHGLSFGTISGTELLAGRSTSQAVELCTVVEQMLSDETAARVFGDVAYGDRLEQIAFNALPAAWNRDLTSIRYYSQTNHVIAQRGAQYFGQDKPDGLVYGPRSGYPCCCFNGHQGWPKFVQNSWAATPDGGLAALVYAPNVVTAKVAGGVGVRVSQEAAYPFEDEVHFKVDPERTTRFPLLLRIPGWCDRPAMTVNGTAVETASAGQFVRLDREWKRGDEIVLKLPVPVRVQDGVHRSVSVHRGPLLFALPIKTTRTPVTELAPGFAVYEQTPASSWNYALRLRPETNATGIELMKSDPLARGANPFTPEHAPVRLSVTARRLPQWGLAANGIIALDPPVSPVRSDSADETLTLVPAGAVELRVVDFPTLTPRVPEDRSAGVIKPDFAAEGTRGLYWLGGLWWAGQGSLRASSNGGQPGFKALIDNAGFSDFAGEARVTPPKDGDAGLIFRVTAASVGTNAFKGYYVGISANHGRVLIGKADGEKWKLLQDASRPIPPDTATRVRVTAVGDRLAVYVGDDVQPCLSVRDNEHSDGQVGLRAYFPSRADSASFTAFSVSPRQSK